MSDALIDLLFWIAVFVIFFFGFRWLQSRRRAAQEKGHNRSGPDGDSGGGDGGD